MIASPTREEDREHYMVLLDIAEILSRTDPEYLKTWWPMVEDWKKRLETHDYTEDDKRRACIEEFFDKLKNMYPK